MPNLNRKIVSQKRGTLLLGLTSAACVAVIIAFPDQAFQASLHGLQVWWKYVFPALLPYFILTELLVGLGILHGIGAILDPLLRLLLRLPGVSGWAITTGAMSGFPTGAKATALLRKEKLIDQDEGERLVALSHLASPVLILSVIGVSFFTSPAIGGFLLVIHYLAAILIAILSFQRVVKIKRRNSSKEEKQMDGNQTHRGTIGSPLAVMKAAYMHDGRSFGKLLGDSVTISVGNLMVIGGYILMFSVLLHALTMSGLIAGVVALLGAIVPQSAAAPLSTAISALMSGIFEPHLGAYAWSQSGLPLMWQVAGVAFVLGWGGFSVHAQVRALTQETDLRYGPFLRFRLLHGMLAAVLTVALWRPWFALGYGNSLPSFLNAAASNAAQEQATAYGMWPMMQQVAIMLVLLLTASCCISLLLRALYLAKRN
ncbi:nucleoside recognition domain-containing protein [Paenibacillus sp. KN14-4R]|uniref:nucleoside recognition domain-containing protein n=1 Tax=Paenibacillus sp. KN14-4R TaxID=3445773 RepID=UPI003FA033C3